MHSLRYIGWQAGLCALLLFPALPILAQPEPYFSMNLYFEDAVGNRDTVVFGYDINATSDLDPEWGEVELTTPFDSVFEVRIAEPTVNDELLADKIITGTGYFANDTTCFEGAAARIYIHALHQPVKLWWDKEPLLTNECFRWTYVIDHMLHELALFPDPAEIPPNYYCMADVDTAYFELPEEQHPMGWPSAFIEKEVEGIGTKLIPGITLWVLPTGTYSPCFWVTEVEDKVDLQALEVYPNPVRERLWVAGLQDVPIRQLQVYDLSGRLMLDQGETSVQQELDVSSWPSGLYTVFLEWQDGKRAVGRFSKQ